MKIDDTPLRVLLSLLACLYAGAALATQLNDLSRPVLGTGLTTLAAAAGGAIGAFAYYSEPDRARMFGMAAANAVLATCAVVLLPLWLGWEWIKPEVKATVEPPLAFVIAFALRWGVPLAVEVGPAWVRQKLGVSPRGDKR